MVHMKKDGQETGKRGLLEEPIQNVKDSLLLFEVSRVMCLKKAGHPPRLKRLLLLLVKHVPPLQGFLVPCRQCGSRGSVAGKASCGEYARYQERFRRRLRSDLPCLVLAKDCSFVGQHLFVSVLLVLVHRRGQS